MSEWKCRSGITLTEICGVYLLVADREAVRECTYVRRVNEIGAFIWEWLSEGRSVSDILSLLREEYDIPTDFDLYADVSRFLSSLSEGHYIQNTLKSQEKSSSTSDGGVS